MSREVEIDGQIVQFVTTSDIAPNGIEELRELCKTAQPSKTGWWNAAVEDAPTGESEVSVRTDRPKGST